MTKSCGPWLSGRDHLRAARSSSARIAFGGRWGELLVPGGCPRCEGQHRRVDRDVDRHGRSKGRRDTASKRELAALNSRQRSRHDRHHRFRWQLQLRQQEDAGLFPHGVVGPFRAQVSRRYSSGGTRDCSGGMASLDRDGRADGRALPPSTARWRIPVAPRTSGADIRRQRQGRALVWMAD